MDKKEEIANLKRDIWIVTVTIAVFALWKLSSLHFRFGDENIYFYMSDAIWRGLVPYRDFFFADPPFFIYLLALFKGLFGSHIILFKALPIVFDSASAVLIFLLLRKTNVFAYLGPIFYLFSFTVLATSDYMTGAEMMIFFLLLAIYLDQREKHFYSGVSWALACLSKLYAGPALLGFLFYKIISKEFLAIKKIILGGLVATFIVLAPFFIIAPHQTFQNLIVHHLHRPYGIDKWKIASVFFKFEWLLVVASIAGIFIARKKLYVYPLIFSAVFFLIYTDLYYMYLHLLMPFIVILTVGLFTYLHTRQEEFAWTFSLFYIFVAIYSITIYANTFAPQGVLDNPQEIAEVLKNAKEDLPIYGSTEVAPLVALISGKEIFDNAIDTNTQSFASGAQDLGVMSQDAVEHGVYFVARIANYPKQNITDTGFEGYFDRKIFESSCVLYKSFDRTSPDTLLNQVAIYKCKKVVK
ncbi:MAG: glycosyltransferase family 39 protein [Patescibacteria group bacterium]|nr:glycosyltransferase family 39 protein [Patescibacteria group bacterium]